MEYEYPKFKKEWWATYHTHVRDELMCCTLKDKCLSVCVKAIVGDVEDLDEVRNTLDTCYDHPEKYIRKRHWILLANSTNTRRMSMLL